MNRSIAVKTFFARASGFFEIPEILIRKRAGRWYPILMYHRVVPTRQEAFPIQAGMYVDLETFEEHINYLKRHFQVIPFSTKFTTERDPVTFQSSRPACILTFDDGWRDFYEFAFPVLKRHGIPATVFLPTKYIGTSEWFWSDRLAVLMTKETGYRQSQGHQGDSVNDVLKKITSLPGGNEKRLESAIAALKGMRELEIEKVLTGLRKMSGNESFPSGRVFLNWDEIREMKESGLVSFGSHTHNHRILVRLEDEEIREELILSKDILHRERVVDTAFIPFCYPNGDWNDRIAEMVRETGYHASVSTGNAWNREGASPFGLKRVPIHQDMTGSRELFGCRVAGIL